MAKRTTSFLLFALFALRSPVAAVEYRIDPAKSVFAVLTHKAGIGSGLAHDHLIVAPKPTVQLEFDPAQPEKTAFTFAVAVAGLEIDAPAARAAWKGRLHELGAHSGELPPVGESDRAKVRTAMLGEDQLAGAKHAEIRAEFRGLERAPAEAGGGWRLPLKLTVKGKSVERSIPVTFEEKAGVLTAEALGEFRFREFGIEPYSTLLGAIRNEDRFHLFVRLQAHAAP